MTPAGTLSANPRDRWTPALVGFSLLISVLSIIFILNYTDYPYPPQRLWIFRYQLRTQDVAGSFLIIALILAACLSWTRNPALAVVAFVARNPWPTAALTFVLLCLATVYVAHSHPMTQDDYAALFQSRVFASGHLTGEFPPDLLERLIPQIYRNRFLYASDQTGAVASAYWPGFALLLAPFSFIGAPWACNPLLASLALVLMGKLAVRFTGNSEAFGWAMLLALGSPAFTAMATTYYSMTAHLLLNLTFVWLLLERTTGRLLLAGVVGSFALALHHPLPHALFALPWILWLATRHDARRSLLTLGAGYAPFVILLGFGWMVVLNDIQGKVVWAMFPSDASLLHRFGNSLWALYLKTKTFLSWPDERMLSIRLAEQERLWSWAVPGLPLLAAAGWWLGRRDSRLTLLGLSMVSTVLGYMVVWFDQGFGWGARYLHPAWGTLPILGAAAMTLVREPPTGTRLRGYVASLALLSLVFATALRATQIQEFVADQLSHIPFHVSDTRQIVFIRYDQENYTADLVQNDPFLRDKVWFMMSFGRQYDDLLLKSRFPGARQISDTERGSVWRLE
jgi:hypothetical protein